MDTILRSAFEIFSPPIHESERRKLFYAAEQNPDAFVGLAHVSDGNAVNSKEGDKNLEKELQGRMMQAVQEEMLSQLQKHYAFGGYSASGMAWAASIDETLANFDRMAKLDNLDTEEKIRGREILEKLQEISELKENNTATDSDLQLERDLMNEGFDIMPTAMSITGQRAESLQNDIESAANVTIDKYKNTSEIENLNTDVNKTIVVSSASGLNF